MDAKDFCVLKQTILGKIKARYEETGVAVSPFFLTPPEIDADPRDAAFACKMLVIDGFIIDTNPDGIPEFIPADETKANP